MGIYKRRLEPNMLDAALCEKLDKLTLVSYLHILVEINDLFKCYARQNNMVSMLQT